MKGKILVDGKLYQKSLCFGNVASKTVFKNRKKYNRKSKYKQSFE